MSKKVSNHPVSFKRFNCIQCGKCCTLTVEPGKRDIEKLKALGHKSFLKNGNLKKVKGACTFLEKRNGRYFCGVHEMKPKACMDYPFAQLSKNKLFSCPGLKQ